MLVRAVPGGVLVEVRVRPRSRPGWKIAAGGLADRGGSGSCGRGGHRGGAPRAGQDPRRAVQPGVAASRRALSREGVRGGRCARRGSEGGAQEGNGRTLVLEVLERLPDVERSSISSAGPMTVQRLLSSV